MIDHGLLDRLGLGGGLRRKRDEKDTFYNNIILRRKRKTILGDLVKASTFNKKLI